MKPVLSYIKLAASTAHVTCVCGWQTLPGGISPFDPQEALVAASVDHMDCPGPRAGMSETEYLTKALRTEVTPLFVNDRDGNPSLLLSRVMHAAMGMVTEAAEAIDMLKKHFIYGKPFDPINLLEEVGDTTWYCALMLKTLGYDFRQAFERNVVKLLKRFPDKFTEDAALNRDLNAERASLEEAVLSNEQMAELCTKLAALLLDPQPGLSTWHTARVEAAGKLRSALEKVL